MITWVLKADNAIYFENNISIYNSDKDKSIILEGKMTIPEMAKNL